jgi:predicted nucleic acid-binding protein
LSWLLDADVLSQPAKKAGNAHVIAWLERHQDQCYTSSIVIAQLAFWVRGKRGRQRVALQQWLTKLIAAMHGRILGFNVSTAHVWAELQHQLAAAGKPMPVEDGYMAAIARRHNLTVVTGNAKDYRRPGIKVFNPFQESDD